MQEPRQLRSHSAAADEAGGEKFDLVQFTEVNLDVKDEERKSRRRDEKPGDDRKADIASGVAVLEQTDSEEKSEEAEEEEPQAEEVEETGDEDEETGEYQPVFEYEDSGFERIIDDEDTGEMFKDAYMQEAIVDKVRAIEFDMESTGTAEVGSLIDSVSKDANGFQRIADEEEAEEKPKKSTRSRRSKPGRIV